MERDWIDRLNTPVTRDAAERATLCRALARPRWDGIKTDLKALVDAYNRHAETRHVVIVEDADQKLVLRGLDQGADIRFYEDSQRIVVTYQKRSRRQRQKPAPVALRLDMQADGLVVLDRRGCPVDDPARLLLEPFFQSLRKAERPSYWERPSGSFPR